MKKYIITDILENPVKYWTKPMKDLNTDESSIQYISDQIEKGYSSGELHISYGKNGEKQASGWWEIVNYRDIALQLRNVGLDIFSTLPKKLNAKQISDLNRAIKRFDDNY